MESSESEDAGVLKATDSLGVYQRLANVDKKPSKQRNLKKMNSLKYPPPTTKNSAVTVSKAAVVTVVRTSERINEWI